MDLDKCLDEKIKAAVKDVLAELPQKDEGVYCIVRSVQAGVFAGNVIKEEGSTFTMTNVRKLHVWYGAGAVQGLALHGTSKPEECRFTPPMPIQKVFNVCESIPASDKAIASIKGVKEWNV